MTLDLPLVRPEDKEQIDQLIKKLFDLRYNQDELMDILVGTEGFYIVGSSKRDARLVLFENIGTKKFPKYKLVDSNYLNFNEVDLITLDSFCEGRGIERIDFIWADIQGAEGDMVRGGRQTLARTRYLYTEYSDEELYENQATLKEILELLPDFRVIELWTDDVLLENQQLKK